MTTTKYAVFYELNAPDCEPELMGEVATVDNAFALVYTDIEAAHDQCPDECPLLDDHEPLADRAAMLTIPGCTHAVFGRPEVVATGTIVWIAVAGRNTYFVFGGDEAAYRARHRNTSVDA
jgi:hypothetical protein